ncbi:MAG TPA: hypothetical protein VFA89_17840 [Terriglobales bacterium]|nr:hypothetical protein [Terriglobales bacterium]
MDGHPWFVAADQVPVPAYYNTDLRITLGTRTSSPRGTVIAAAFLIAALAGVVIYTSTQAFRSPLAILVLAAIGFAALLLQLTFRREPRDVLRSPKWLNAAGILFAILAIFADKLRLSHGVRDVGALASVGCFGISSVIVLNGLRKRRMLPK